MRMIIMNRMATGKVCIEWAAQDLFKALAGQTCPVKTQQKRLGVHYH